MLTEFYYWCYLMFKQAKSNDTPAFNACLTVGLFPIMNIASAISYFDLLNSVNQNKILLGTLLISILWFVFLFFHLFSKKDEIIAMYENKSSKRKIIGKIGSIAYVILSFSLLIIN